MKTSKKGTKKFTEAEKLGILKEAQSKGVKETLTKYGLYPATYYYWKRNFQLYGTNGLEHKKTKDTDNRNKLLAEENARLKMLLAEKELQLKYPDISLKKIGRAWKRSN